jgi:putative two-component system response regulator
MTETCLVVDDEPAVRRTIVRMLASQGLDCAAAANGVEALRHLEQTDGMPLVVTDLRMPELDGMGLLGEITARWPDTSVIVLSGLAETGTAIECLRRGAADFLLKPISSDELRERVARALQNRTLVLENRQYQLHLEQRVAEQAERIQELYLEGVQMLARALEAKDAYTSGHSLRVSHYSVETAIRLGVAGELLGQIRLGGELHDIGKIGTREAVLHKPGRLTAVEFDHIIEHPVLGERMLAPLARQSPAVLRIVRSHHERWDGRGFPDGLAGEEIPLEARIVAVADAFDAMTTERPYRAARSPEEALAELRRVAGTQLDARVVDAFATVLTAESEHSSPL